jgi:transcription termination/antitermination protein NusA
VIAGLLVTEGFTSIEDVIAVDDDELASIEGFDESVAAELKRRAESFLEQRDVELDDKRRELGVEDAVAEAGGFTPAQLVALGEKGVKTLDDLADLASDELIEILGTDSMDEDTANAIIMAARQHWFESEDGEAPEGETPDAEQQDEAPEATEQVEAPEAAGEAVDGDGEKA